eukprot:TRINITY_DN10154_c0_g1_i1.p1 TRINITY_DN10154_c0_g1~~TRINITY_DN10154_c0_g1_i1.p1  ORF type:complete len:108 (+),score=0.76 TRINITY_DN10154_c0_g1_i1:207-530(+)
MKVVHQTHSDCKSVRGENMKVSCECIPVRCIDQARAARILATAFEGLRVAAICLAPVIPSTARLLLQRIGVHDDTQLLWSHVGYDTSRLAGRLIQPGPPLISKEPMV